MFEDLGRVVLPDPPETDMRGVLLDNPETRLLLDEHTRTWEEEGRIIAMVGVSPMWTGVGQVWTMLTDEARTRGVMLTRGVLRFLEMLHKERGYWRLQATVAAGDEIARLWIIQLKFGFEGMMNAYGPDKRAHAMYARLVI